MTFTKLRPVPTGGTPKSGIRASAKVDRAAGVELVRLSINAKAQEELFDGPISEKRFDLEVGRGPDQGKLRMRENADGAFRPRKMMKGTVLFSISAWYGLPDGAHKPSDCEAEDVQDGIILRLPDWAREPVKSAKGVTLA